MKKSGSKRSDLPATFQFPLKIKSGHQGAVKFLYKPFSDSDLLDAVNATLDGE
jgi:FixJ family two-component response regulator